MGIAAALLLAGAAGVLAEPPGAADAVPQWTDGTAASGISFRRAGDRGENSFLPVIGGGACFADFDGDGFDDLYLVNGRYNESWWTSHLDPRSKMFRSNGDGTFADVTDEMRVAHRGWGGGCAAGDYDFDGDLDLFVASWGENTLYRNDGPGGFSNATIPAGVSAIGKCGGFGCWGQAPSFVDLDEDGCLDLYVTNYVAYNNDIAIPGANGPEHYDGQTNLFYRNRCDGTFVDETAARNLSGTPGPDRGKSFMGMWFDYEGDGDLDLYVTNDMVVNDLMLNENGVFRDIAVQAGVEDDRASMGLDVQDVSGDGRPDLYFTHYVTQTNGFYRALPGGGFADHSNDGTFPSDQFSRVGWGTAFTDWDADGDVDFLAVNGHTRQIFEEYAHIRHLYRNDGGFTFTNVTNQAGPGMAGTSVARGLAMADVEHDGDLDFLVLNTGNTTAQLLKGSGVTNHWLEISLRQSTRNARAIGASITVTPEGGAPVVRLVHTSASYLSQHSQYEYFGLGSATKATVTVRWPDGASETWTNVAGDRVVRLTRGDPTPKADVFSPLTTASVSPAPYIGWRSTPATVTLASEDRGVTLVSGVALVEYRTDGGAWTTYAGPFEVGEGEHLVEYRATDAAGNVEPARRAIVRVDTTRPTVGIETTGEVAGWLTEDSRVRVRGEDAESGIVEAEWRYAGESAWRTFEAPFAPEGNGVRTIELRAINAAGLASVPTSVDVAVDTTPPASTLATTGPTLESGSLLYVTSDTRLALDATDTASGVARIEWSLNESPWVAYTGPIEITGNDGLRAFRYRAVDVAGHAEPAHERGLFLDNDQPPAVFLHEPRPGTLYADGTAIALPDERGTPLPDGLTILLGTVTVEASATRDVSGNRFMRAWLDGELRFIGSTTSLHWVWETGQESFGQHTLTISASDLAGNEQRVDRAVYII